MTEEPNQHRAVPDNPLSRAAVGYGDALRAAGFTSPYAGSQPPVFGRAGGPAPEREDDHVAHVAARDDMAALRDFLRQRTSPDASGERPDSGAAGA